MGLRPSLAVVVPQRVPPQVAAAAAYESGTGTSWYLESGTGTSW